MHSSELLDDNLEEYSEGLVEEYPSSNQDLDDYTEAEGDGTTKLTRAKIYPRYHARNDHDKDRLSSTDDLFLIYFIINLLFVLVQICEITVCDQHR